LTLPERRNAMKSLTKCSVLLLSVLTLAGVGELLAHEQWTHEYLVMEGYRLLKEQKQLSSQFDSFFQLDHYGAPVHPSACLTAQGAWVEDDLDIVFGYCSWFPIVPCYETTNSHFWNPDNSDPYAPNHLVYRDLMDGYYENALKKAEIFWTPDRNIFMPGPWNFSIYEKEMAVLDNEGIDPYSTYAGMLIQYETLPRMFSTRTYSFVGVVTVAGRTVMFSHPYSIVLSTGYLDVFFSANILGRIILPPSELRQSVS
jgi:hypothetical protein